MEIITSYLTKISLIIVLALAAFVGMKLGGLYNRFITTEIKQSVCKTAVRFVEQVYKDLHGEEKLLKAMEKAADLLAEKGIPINAAELKIMLEAAVNEFNDNFRKATGEIKAPTEGLTEALPDYDPDDYSELTV